MLKKIILGILVVVLVAVGVAFLLPSQVHVERSLQINVPAERVFQEVNDLKRWHAWSPWHAQEPDAKYSYSGPEAGKGQKAEWVGEKIGKGSQAITESTEPTRIVTQLDFGPKGNATSEWRFESNDEGTKVTWGFDTNLGMNPVQRYTGLMVENFIGPDYEKGLSSLKEVCEKENQVDPAQVSEPGKDPKQADAPQAGTNASGKPADKNEANANP